MKRETLTTAKAAERANQMPYALIRTAEDVYLGRTPTDIELSTVTEAHFFDGASELRVFVRNGQREAVLLTVEDSDIFTNENRRIENAKFGKKLLVKRVLSFDEDGQAFPAATILCGWEDK